MSSQKRDYDVIVVGGGMAGVVATIASARNKAKTLLIEKTAVLGGNATAGLVTVPFSFHSFVGEQVVKGIPQEIVEANMRLGSLGHIPCPVRLPKMTATPHNEEAMVQVCMEMVLKEGADLLLHSFVSGVIEDAQRLTGIQLVNKSGLQILSARVVVDATGDGDVAAYAGAETLLGRKEDGLQIPPTVMFKMTNVDSERIFKYIENHQDQFNVSKGWSVGYDSTLPGIFVNLANFRKEWEKGKDEGMLSPMIDEQHSSFYIFKNQPDEAYVNMTRILGIDSTDGWSLTQGEIEGRRQAFNSALWLKKYIPGFESAGFVLASHLGIRDGRRIVGEYLLTEEDVLEGREFFDVIAKTSTGIDFHSYTMEHGHYFKPTKDGGTCDIPYRCLIPKEVDNLLVAGRCISSGIETMGHIRSIVACMATGQAAGTAAALSAKEGIVPRKLNISKLQKTLVDQGAVL